MGYFGFWRWCLDMNINHQLKFSFLDFLSNQTFFNSEFKKHSVIVRTNIHLIIQKKIFAI